jgi:hypothetical protein
MSTYFVHVYILSFYKITCWSVIYCSFCFDAVSCYVVQDELKSCAVWGRA